MKIDAARDALIIVDLQPDFLPGGALAVAGGDQIVEPIARLSHSFHTVVATQDFHPPGHVSFGRWPVHCVAGSPGAALHPALPDERLSLILRKGTRREVDSYSAFRENESYAGHRASTGLAAWLRARGIERVFICGLARDYCVLWTALDAAAEGFATFVLDDLTRPVEPHRAGEVDAALEAGHVHRTTSAALERA